MGKRLTQNEISTVDLLVNYAMEAQPNQCEILPCADIDNLPEGLSALRNYGMELHLLGIIDEWANFKKAEYEKAKAETQTEKG